MSDRKKNFNWRHQPPQESDKAKMLNYIDNQQLHPSHDKTQMMLKALTPFYMLPTLLSEGNCSPETLDLILRDSLQALEEHFKYLCALMKVKIEPTRVSCLPHTGIGITPESGSSDLDNSDDVDASDLDDWNVAGVVSADREFFNY